MVPHVLLISAIILATLIGGGSPCGPRAADSPRCSTDSGPACGQASGCCADVLQCCCAADPGTPPQAPIQPVAPRIVLTLPPEPIRLAAALPARREPAPMASRARSSDRPARTLHCVWLT